MLMMLLKPLPLGKAHSRTAFFTVENVFKLLAKQCIKVFGWRHSHHFTLSCQVQIASVIFFLIHLILEVNLC